MPDRMGRPVHGSVFTVVQAAVGVPVVAHDAGKGSVGAGRPVQESALHNPAAGQVGLQVLGGLLVVQVPSIGIEPTTPALGEPCSIH